MGPSDNIKVVFGLKVIGEKKAVETEIEIFLYVNNTNVNYLIIWFSLKIILSTIRAHEIDFECMLIRSLGFYEGYHKRKTSYRTF